MSPGQPGVSSEYCAPAHARPASAVHMAKTIDPAPRSTSLPLFLPGVGQRVLDRLEPVPGTALLSAEEAKRRPREMSWGSSSGGSGAKTRPRLAPARQKLLIVMRRA
jgi:hypothetical protein